MAGQRNYLLGYGERLTTPVEPPGEGARKRRRTASRRLATFSRRWCGVSHLPLRNCPRAPVRMARLSLL